MHRARRGTAAATVRRPRRVRRSDRPRGSPAGAPRGARGQSGGVRDRPRDHEEMTAPRRAVQAGRREHSTNEAGYGARARVRLTGSTSMPTTTGRVRGDGSPSPSCRAASRATCSARPSRRLLGSRAGATRSSRDPGLRREFTAESAVDPRGDPRVASRPTGSTAGTSRARPPRVVAQRRRTGLRAGAARRPAGGSNPSTRTECASTGICECSFRSRGIVKDDCCDRQAQPLAS